MIYNFYLEEWKLKKFKTLFGNLPDRTKYVIPIKNFKQALNHGLVFKKVHRVIKFNQKSCLKRHIDMNTELSKKQKIKMKIISNLVFAKTIESV